GHAIGALQVHLDDGVPVLFAEVGKALVAQDAGVVDEDVDAAEGLDRRLQDRLAAGDVRHVHHAGDCASASGGDFGDDLLRGVGVHVVDDDGCAFAGEQAGIGTAQAAAGAGDDGNL